LAKIYKEQKEVNVTDKFGFTKDKLTPLKMFSLGSSGSDHYNIKGNKRISMCALRSV